MGISLSGVTIKDMYPREVKDIFAGSQVLLLGRYKGSGASTVTISGKVNGVAKTFNFPVNFAASQSDNGSLPRLWAMRRIAHLTDVAQENGSNREVVDEIVALSQKYGIISAYTSFLVTDPSENHRINMNMNGPVLRPVPAASPMTTMGGVISGLQGLSRRGDFEGRQVAQRSMMASASTTAGTYALRRKSGALREESHAGFGGGAGGASITDARGGLDKGFAMQQLAALPATGKVAFDMAKKQSELKNFNSIAAADEKSRDKDQASRKEIAGKSFMLKDGFWTDSEYKGEKAEVVKFGSGRYFELAFKLPSMSSYLSVGKQVIVVVKGQAYKIVLQ